MQPMDLRQRTLDYLNALELVTGWRLSRIAREAGLQSTTLTRFVNSADHKFALSGRTLHKLRERYGFGPGEAPVPFNPAARARSDRASDAQRRYETGSWPVRKDVPVHSVAEAAFVLPDGETTEAMVIEPGYAGSFVARPASLEGAPNLLAFYVPGSAMDPRFRTGELAMVDPNRPPRVGDDVLVVIGQTERGARSALLKHLVDRTEDGLVLEEYRPHRRFLLPAHQVLAVQRILSLEEILRG